MTEISKTAEILKYFQLLCSIPHGSGNEKQISDFICEELYELGLSPTQDAAGNVICDVAGMEGAPVVALQGHIDMVCAVGSLAYRPQTDPIKTVRRDGWLCSTGDSSLGADCGAGIAVMLWLAAHAEHVLPPLRLFFTVGEEIGLHGAAMLDAAFLKDVDMLINLDGFTFGRAVISAAGGVRMKMHAPLETVPADTSLKAYRLSLSGFRGGHSGFDIDKDRANAISLLGGALREYADQNRVCLASISGGTAWNAIPANAECILLTDGDLEELVSRLNVHILFNYGQTDPDGRFKLEPADCPEEMFSDDLTRRVIGLLTECYTGIFALHETFEELVGDSVNLGVLRTTPHEVVLQTMARFSTEEGEINLVGQHEFAAECNNFAFEVSDRYAPWPIMENSRLQMLMQEAYHAVTGDELELTAVHVGLETGVLQQKNPALDCISIGMTIENPHSTAERWEIGTIEPFTETLLRLLSSIPEK